MGWGFIGIGLAGLPAFWCLYLGQFGLICSALLIYGLARIEVRPWLAGAALACLFIKPQFAVLVPVVMLARGDWRALSGGLLTLAGLAVVSTFCFGWQVWPAFFGPGQASMRMMLQAPFGPGYEMGGASVFWLIRSFGAGIGLAYAAQCLVLMAACIAAWRLWRRQDVGHDVRLALTVCLMQLANPHAYIDDLVAYSLVLPMLARRDTPVANAVLALLWLAPALAVRFAQNFGFLPLPFCLAAAALMAWRWPQGAGAPAVYPRAPGMALRP
jgi:alpha-1,2-mannosyltransferase